MKISAEKKILVTALARIQGIVEKTSIKPITTHALIKAHNAQILIAATNLQIGMQATYRDVSVHQEGTVAVNARMLFEIIKEMPEGSIGLEEKDNHTIEITSGKKIKFKIAGSPPDDFPVIFKEMDVVDNAWKKDTFLELLNLTAFSMSHDETTMNINGAFLENIEGQNIRMVTTDGYRLSIVDEKVESVIPLAEGIIIPYKAVIELQKILHEKKEEKNIYLHADEKTFSVRIGEIDIRISLIEKKFPDYRVIIPGDGYKKIEIPINRDVLTPALKRMAIISSENNRPVVFLCKENQLEISSEDSDRGTVREKMTLSAVIPGEIKFCINCSYLLDIILAAEDDVIIDFNAEEENKPIIVRPEKKKEKAKYIVMPMLMD